MFFKLLVLPVILLYINLLNAQPPSIQQMEQARAEFNEGIRAGVEDDFIKAKEYFSKAIEINPIYAEAFLYRGLSSIEMGDYSNAISDLTIAIELDPAFSDQAHYFRGVARYWRQEYHQALDDLSVAIHMNPDYVAFFQRGKVYMNLNNFQRALLDFETSIQLNPDFYEAYLYRGVTLYHLGETEKADMSIETVRDFLPDHNLVNHYQELVSQTETVTEKTHSEPQSPRREINIADFFNRQDDIANSQQKTESQVTADLSQLNEAESLHFKVDADNAREIEHSDQTLTIETLQTGIYDFSLKGAKPTGFGIQVASYYNYENLENLANAYSEKYQTPVFIHISKVNGRKLFRLILGMFTERTEAESYRDELRKADFTDSFLVIFDRL